jgi:hypothetical protein
MKQTVVKHPTKLAIVFAPFDKIESIRLYRHHSPQDKR